MHDLNVKDILDFISGDERCLKMVFDKFHSSVYNYCLRFVKSESVAEEICSDVFLKLWQRREAINPEKGISGLIFKITHNYIIDHLRQTSRAKKLREKFIKNYTEKSEFNLEDELVYNEYQNIVKAAISKLPAKRKIVFSLYHFEKKEIDQIATDLNISINTVKVHLVQSRSFIKKYLVENEFLY